MHAARILTMMAMTALVAACKPPATAPQGAMPEVTVAVIQPQAVSITSDLPGRTSAYRVAQVRARVDGIVLRREFVEGSDVKAGQSLYRIDPAPYQAAFNSATASLEKAQANLKVKKLQADRFNALIGQHAVSQQAYDDAIAAYHQSQADVAVAEAALQAARIQLGYTYVLSPLDGRIGKSMVTEGAYVRQGEATPMATVQQLDQIYVDVSQSSADVLRLRHDFDAGLLEKSETGAARVSLVQEDGSVYSEPGSLQFSDSTVDESTGTVTLRAIFPNPKRQLLPGMFVHARLETGVSKQALLVPQQAVTYNPKGQPTAMVVGEGDKVELRVLQVSRSLGNQWQVTAGLQAGDRVVTEGLQKIKPGVTVKVAAPAAAAPAAAPAANR